MKSFSLSNFPAPTKIFDTPTKKDYSSNSDEERVRSGRESPRRSGDLPIDISPSPSPPRFHQRCTSPDSFMRRTRRLRAYILNETDRLINNETRFCIGTGTMMEIEKLGNSPGGKIKSQLYRMGIL